MADTIHKKRKDYPHFDHFYLGSPDYRNNYDRIFGKEGENEKGKKLQKQKGVQKVAGIRSHSQGVSRKNPGKNKGKISQSKTQ